MTNPSKNPLEDLVPAIMAGVEEWRKTNSDAAVSRRVREYLDANLQFIVMTALGFSKSYGQWEVDRCNGRNSHTYIGKELEALSLEASRTWIQQAELPAMKESEVLAMQRYYSDELKSHLKKLLYKKAMEVAQQQADAIMQTASGTDFVAAFAKLHNMLNGQQGDTE